MDMIELFKSLKSKEIGGLYLFYGREELLKREAVDIIRDILVPGSLEELNLTVMDAASVSANEIINAVETMPLANPRRLVVVKDVVFGGAAKRTFNQNDMNILEEYLSRIPEYSCLVMNAKGKPDMRTRFVKAFKAQGQVVEFGRLKPKLFENWVKKQFKSDGKSMSGAAFKKFIRLIGYSNKDSEKTLDDVVNEIEKLVQYCEDKKTIREEDIEMLVTESSDRNIFSLVDAIGGKDTQTAIGLLEDMKRSEEPPVRILFMIARQFRLLIKSALLREAGYSNKAISSQLRLPPFVTSSLIRQAKNYSGDGLKRALKECWEAEVSIKSGRIEPWLALELLIIELGIKKSVL